MAVTPYERDVIDLAIALVEDSEPRLHVPALVREGTRTGLSQTALDTVSRVFSRGIARRLARAGASRLWEQAPPLVFGSASLDLLHWLHTTSVSPNRMPPLVLRSLPTVAETLLFARAIDLIEASGVHQLPDAFVALPWLWVFRGQQLLALDEPNLAFTDRLDDEGWLPTVCHRELRGVWGRWSRVARASSVEDTVRHGNAQAVVARALLEHSKARPERVAFLIDLAAHLAELHPDVWEVDRGRATLSLWQRARQARVALLEVVLDVVGGWNAEWRATGFVDDGYEQTQRWLRRYEPGLRALHSLRHPVERARQLPEVS